MGADPGPTYTNPVYPHACPDPFVLKFCGEYWCYFTGIQPDGRCFGILHSRDLVHWQAVGSAMDPLPGGQPCYWAPEVTYENGRFYLYYSVGNETVMHIRVAVAERPEGPFVDSGRQLTDVEFAIDAHLFVDDDGQRYLFYAVDFLHDGRIGTGTVFDRMLDPFTLEGRPRPVSRAQFDWQIYDPRRETKGGVCWHTVEGPFVLKHGGRYYQMFSGGNWQNESYGLAYAVADGLEGEGEWRQVCDGVSTLPILRSLPEQGVIGPGHNSVVRGPDNRELFCVYHRWQPETDERVLAIDRMGWEGERLLVYGPTAGPTPVPSAPLAAGFSQTRCLEGSCEVLTAGDRLELSGGSAQAALDLPREGGAAQSGSEASPTAILEMSLKAGVGSPEHGEPEFAAGAIGLALAGPSGVALRFALYVEPRQAVLESAAGSQVFPLPPDFNPLAFHLLRLELEGETARLYLDDEVVRAHVPVAAQPEEIRLFAQGAAATFAGFALTL